MTPSAALISFLEAWEGLPGGGPALVPYQDSSGHWTNGYGHVCDDQSNPPTLTAQQCQVQLLDDIAVVAAGVTRAVTISPALNEFDAFVSFAYNVGLSAFRQSTLLRLFNQSHFTAAALQFTLWDHADGQVSKGLERRRIAEQAIYMNGDYSIRP
jgi:lysozyme